MMNTHDDIPVDIVAQTTGEERDRFIVVTNDTAQFHDFCKWKQVQDIRDTRHIRHVHKGYSIRGLDQQWSVFVLRGDSPIDSRTWVEVKQFMKTQVDYGYAEYTKEPPRT